MINLLDEKEAARRGKKPNTKTKTRFFLQYLLRESDREHPKNADDIVQYSEEDAGIYAEEMEEKTKQSPTACVCRAFL